MNKTSTNIFTFIYFGTEGTFLSWDGRDNLGKSDQNSTRYKLFGIFFLVYSTPKYPSLLPDITFLYVHLCTWDYYPGTEGTCIFRTL